MQDWHGTKPTALSGYLEAMVRSIFTAGINWKVVEAKWSGIREAFGGFDVEKVAALTPADVERLAGDTRVIRNRRKIEAIVDNAAKMLELDKAPGGFAGYLRLHGDYKETIADLKHDFSFLGDSTAYFFLAMVGEPVPSPEECDWTHGGAHKGAHHADAQEHVVV
jgi:3-methyladenine DNA glycosylase Tag